MLQRLSRLVAPREPAPAAAGWLETYLRDGVVVVPGVFDAEYIATITSAWRAFKLEIARRPYGSKPGDRNNRFVYGLLPSPIGDIYKHPRLVEMARAVLGPDVALYMNRILLKDESYGDAVTMHQDTVYFSGSQHKLSVFVPLAHVGPDNGGLNYVLGSHRYGSLVKGAIDRSRFAPMPDLRPSVEPGDIVLMDFCTWHWSESAVERDDRPLMQLAYQPADDGSYYGELFGVAEPTLVCGRWRTEHFAACGHGVVPDA